MTALLHLAPALVILALLWRGRYPGEARILALRDRPGAGRMLARAGCSRPRRVSVVPRAGALIAERQAGRAPPHACPA